MNFKEIKKVALNGEGEQVEFKETTGQIVEVGKTICGFLNKRGGVVLIGVNDKGKIIGQHVSDKTQQDIAHVLNDITPSAPVDFGIINIPNDDKKVIFFKTHSLFSSGVYFFRDKAYERVGSSTRSMKYERLRQLMLERTYDKVWDQLPAQGYDINDLEENEILKTTEDGIRSGRLDETVVSKENILGILRGLDLTVNNHLTNAAVVLFAKKMSSQYSQCEIKLARFKGITKDIGFIDEKSFTGNAFRILGEAEMFVKRHLNIGIEFSHTSMERIETPQLPFLAVREAIINAICHRDYVFYSGSLALAIYDDRLEVWNMGELQDPLNFEDLKGQHLSILRNKKISNVFYTRKFIEKWGSGTTRMINMCNELGVPEPIFQEYSGGFSVTFRFKKNEMISEEKKIVSFEELTERQVKIIKILKANLSGLPVSEILSIFNASGNDEISLATLKRELNNLKEKRHIIVKGKGRNTRWLSRK